MQPECIVCFSNSVSTQMNQLSDSVIVFGSSGIVQWYMNLNSIHTYMYTFTYVKDHIPILLCHINDRFQGLYYLDEITLEGCWGRTRMYSANLVRLVLSPNLEVDLNPGELF